MTTVDQASALPLQSDKSPVSSDTVSGKFLYRKLQSADLKAALEVVCEGFGCAYLDESDLKECSAIKDLSQRKKEILSRLNEKSQGKITTIEQAGSPDDVLNCSTTQDITAFAKEPFEDSFVKGLSCGVFEVETGNLAGVICGNPCSPETYLKSSTSHHDTSSDYPISALLLEMEEKFATLFLNDGDFSRYRALHETQEKQQGMLLHFEMIAIRPQYRGYKLSQTLMAYFLNSGYQLGFRMVFAECASPVTHYLTTKVGFMPILSCSISYVDYELHGSKPFSSIEFKSCVPGGDNCVLFVFGVISELSCFTQDQLKEPSTSNTDTESASDSLRTDSASSSCSSSGSSINSDSSSTDSTVSTTSTITVTDGSTSSNSDSTSGNSDSTSSNSNSTSSNSDSSASS